MGALVTTTVDQPVAPPAARQTLRDLGWRDLLVRFDLHGNVQWMNPAACEWFGRCRTVAALATSAARPSEAVVSWQRLPLGPDWLWLSALGEQETRSRERRGGRVRAVLFEVCQWRTNWNLRLLGAQGTIEIRSRETWRQGVSRRLSAELLGAVEAERGRLARELHDDSGQSLAGLIVNLELTERQLDVSRTEALARLARCRELAALTLGQIRRLSHDLHPPEWGSESFTEAVEWLVENLGLRQRLEVETDIAVPVDLEPAVRTVLYRALQEALTNILKHAQAGRIGIQARLEGGAAVLEVADDGVGFEPAALRPGRGIGLRNIRHRAESLGGSCAMRSAPGQGSRLRISVPVAGNLS
jgi:signal transduction histidine kinase